MTAQSILNTIKAHKATIRGYGVKRIGLFGSYGRSQQKKNSDIDIIVEFKKGKKTFDNYYELKNFLEGLFEERVDVVIKDALKKRIKSQVIKDTQYAEL